MAEQANAKAKSPFKAFVGIDFGTDGSGLAYALPDGSAFIHNMWDDTDPTQKPKTSVLFDNQQSIIRVGTGAQNMYLGCTEDKGWKLFERFKMNLYEEPTNKSALKAAESKMDYVELKQEIATTNDALITESSSTVFIAQLEYLKKHAFKFIDTHLTKKVKNLKGDVDHGWPEIQFFLTVPAIWSDKAKDQMVEWAIESGLVDGTVPNQLKIVYEPDCASLSIQHAIIRALNGDDNDENALDANKKTKKRKRGKKMAKLIPKVSINVPFAKGDKYILLDVGGGTCDVACHQVMGSFAIKEVLHPSGGKWGATYIDERFMELIGDLFSRNLMNIYRIHESEGRQSYLKFLQHFLNKSKLSYYQNYDTDKDIPLYHDIEMPANFVNFIVTQYAAKYKAESTADEDGMEQGLKDLNDVMRKRSAKYKRKVEANPPAEDTPCNPTDEEGDKEVNVNERFKDRDWMVKIIEIDDDEDEGMEEDYMLSVHNDVWAYLFGTIITPIIAHCKNILSNQKMRDTKYIFLVGGFANSKYFQMRTQEAFEPYQNIKIITPGLPGLCVVDGAARYGLDKNFVKIRKMPKTYGIEISNPKASLNLSQFPAGHVQKHTYYNERYKCDYVRHCFSTFVKKGQEIKLDEKPIKKQYSKGKLSDTSISIRIFCSTSSNPLTTTEATSFKLAQVTWPIGENEQHVIVEFSFSNTLITVHAYPKGKPHLKKQIKIDYFAKTMKGKAKKQSLWTWLFG
eukprot:216771_1